MIKIKEITWLSEEIREAVVLISDESNELICFAHPLTLKPGDVLKESIHPFNISNIALASEKGYSIEKHSDAFSYSLTAKLFDLDKGILILGEIRIEIEKELLPKDIGENEFISFSCDRLDIW